jgi:hypothetical protein
MDGSSPLPATCTHEWLVARSATLRERVHRVRRNQRPLDEPAPRDHSDAAILGENDRILRSIEESAARELAQIELALARLAGSPGGP